MRQLRVGDRVKCISAGNNDPGIVTIGKIYTILGYDLCFEYGDSLQFINDEGELDWFGVKYFKKVNVWKIAFRYKGK